MRRSVWMRVLAAVLIISMLAAPVSAAARRPSPSYGTNCIVGGIISIIRDIIRDIWDDWFDVPGDEDPEPTPPEQPTDPSEPTEPGETEPEDPTEPEESLKTVLNLIEGHANTANGHLLRGVTYSLSQLAEEQSKPESTPGSLRDIKAIAIGAARAAAPSAQLNAAASSVQPMAETETTISDTALEITYDDAGNAVIDSGDYVLGFDGGKYLTNVEGSTDWGTTLTSTATKDAATIWTITRQDDGTYTIQDPNDKYFAILARNDAAMSDTVIYMAIQSNENNTVIKQLNTTNQNCFVNALGGLNTGAVGGWTAGTSMKFYAVTAAVDPADDSRDIPLPVLTATAENYQSGDDPDHVLDEDNGTIWHTVHRDSERATHWIQIELSEGYKVDGLRYLPRQDSGTNGNITGYEVQVSNDGQTFRTVATGTWDGNSEWKLAHFTEEQVKYVRLVATSALPTSGNKFASAAEIRLTGTKVVTPSEPEQPAIGSEVVFFPVTMFNYNNGISELNDDDIMRTLTHQAEVEAGLKEKWEGLYFSGGKPSPTSYTYTTEAASHSDLSWQQVIDGTYYADEACTNRIVVSEVIEGSTGYNETTVPVADIWDAFGGADVNTWYKTEYMHLYYGNYYPIGIRLGDDGYYYIGWEWQTDGYMQLGLYTIDQTTTVYAQAGTITGYTLVAGGKTLATLDGTDLTAKVGVPLYTAAGEVTVNKSYAEWNWWAYETKDDAARNKFYAGLVQDELVDGELKFNVPEPGIFTFDSAHPEITNDGIKDIYQNVGLPFVKNNKGYYTFDSDANGTYFADTNGDGKSDPWYGAEDDFFNMYLDYGVKQGWDGMYYGDGSSNLWAPYNTNANDTGEDAIDYHFGMRADIPFSMTPNGRIKSNDDNSEPITFTFKGDDDVWIFIDGHLVIDLGGIHNRLGATIDFANNTITYFKPESNTNNNEFGAYNVEDFELVQKLYNDADGEGALGQTRANFSTVVDHEMSIFYLERGKGTSNCQIEFNLPMLDTILVTKEITHSWSAAADEGDGDNGDGTEKLTAKEQAAVDKLDFKFKLWKKEIGGRYTAVANTNYYLLDKDDNILGIYPTGADGTFSLKNGQTAMFMTDLGNGSVTYAVEELDLDLDTFLTPDYKFAGLATNGFDFYGETLNNDTEDENDTKTVSEHLNDASLIGEQELPMDAEQLVSYDVTPYGSIEAIESLEFICTNYLNAELPNPTARAYEDIIVIDYGLPVQVDPLHNDLFRGDDIEIVAWGDETLELNEVLTGDVAVEDGTEGGTSWTGNKFFSNTTTEAQVFDSGNVTFTDVTYAEHEHVITNDDGTKTTTYTYTRDSFEYELTEQLTEVEEVRYIIKVNSTVEEEIGDEIVPKTACRYALGKIYIVPATIMYYEENFSDMVTFTGSGWRSDATVEDQENVSAYQESGVVGTVGDSTYGSDVAYLSDDGDSNGTYRFGDTTHGAIRFTYTFTGTGSSIFARTSASTGYMQVKLYRGTEITDEALEDITYRDTYWKDENGSELDNAGTLYNIPVYSTDENLDYDTYTVVCTIAKKGTITAGNDKGAGNEFYLDGIRVLRPLDIVIEQDGVWDEEGNLTQPIVYDELTTKALGAYADDGETNLDVVTLRQKLITDYDYLLPEEDENGEVVGEKEQNWPFAVLTDIEGKILLASDYISIGPKNEVYLSKETSATNGQSVTFSLKYWQPEGLKLYMGMKAPFGHASVNVGHETIELNNAPDCYYDVTKNYASLEEKTDENGNTYYVVTYTFEAAESIVSLTNIKVVGNYEFLILEQFDEEVDGSTGDGNG